MKTLKTTFAILCIALLSISCSPEDGIDGTNGINGVPVYYNPITITGLNNGSVNVTETSWTILNIGTKTFNKVAGSTYIDIKFRSNIYSGIFSSFGAIQYELLVDGNPGFSSSNFFTYASDKIEYVILDSTFTNLTAGSHTITIRAKMNNETSTGVRVDYGNYGGKIIVQER